MKVILLDSVRKLGNRFDIVEVKPGFAHNFLVPQKKALIADEDNLSRIDEIKKERQADVIAGREALSAELAKVTGPITISVAVNEVGGLYQAVSEEQIATAAKEQYGTIIDPNYMHTDTIKSVGEYTVMVSYDEELSTPLNVIIKTENEEAPKKTRKKAAIVEENTDEPKEEETVSDTEA